MRCSSPLQSLSWSRPPYLQFSVGGYHFAFSPGSVAFKFRYGELSGLVYQTYDPSTCLSDNDEGLIVDTKNVATSGWVLSAGTLRFRNGKFSVSSNDAAAFERDGVGAIEEGRPVFVCRDRHFKIKA